MLIYSWVSFLVSLLLRCLGTTGMWGRGPSTATYPAKGLSCLWTRLAVARVFFLSFRASAPLKAQDIGFACLHPSLHDTSARLELRDIPYSHACCEVRGWIIQLTRRHCCRCRPSPACLTFLILVESCMLPAAKWSSIATV